ncbi:MAG: biopolymer transporter ExbD [Bacteroidia bacterium]|nr:biopolymer transporter ExbD [Bacteroidia bacterium]
MADLDTGGGGGHGKKGGPKTKKKSTKIDMTAMVDVAFLLLTFFVLTATMSSEGVKEMIMPPKLDELPEDEQKKKIVEDKIMTIVLDENDQIQYYIGITDIEIKNTDFSEEGLRKAIMVHLRGDGTKPRCDEVDNQGLNENKCWDPIFVIKAKKNSRYRNLVDLLDEMTVTGAPKYAIDKYTDDDSVRIEQALEAAALEAEEG